MRDKIIELNCEIDKLMYSYSELIEHFDISEQKPIESEWDRQQMRPLAFIVMDYVSAVRRIAKELDIM